jgi:hypothetical protein
MREMDARGSFTQPFVGLIPLRNWTGSAMKIRDGLEIRRLKEAELPDFKSCHYFIAGNEIQDLQSARFWLWHDFEHPFPMNKRFRDAIWQRLSNAVLCTQMLTPCGNSGFGLMCSNSDRRLTPESVLHRHQLQRNRVGPYRADAAWVCSGLAGDGRAPGYGRQAFNSQDSEPGVPAGARPSGDKSSSPCSALDYRTRRASDG